MRECKTVLFLIFEYQKGKKDGWQKSVDRQSYTSCLVCSILVSFEFDILAVNSVDGSFMKIESKLEYF